MLHKEEKPQSHEEWNLIFLNSLLLMYPQSSKQDHDVIESKSLVKI